MDDYIAKPVDIKRLKKCIEEWTAPAPAAGGTASEEPRGSRPAEGGPTP